MKIGTRTFPLFSIPGAVSPPFAKRDHRRAGIHNLSRNDRRRVEPILEQGSGLKAGKDFYLAYTSPERRSRELDSQVAKIPKVIGGHTAVCLEKAKAVYQMAIESLVPVSSCRAAEATKLLENIHRSINIALVNELKPGVRQTGHRHLGSDRGCQDQTLWVHALLSRTRSRRAPAPSIPLPFVAEATRHGHSFH